MRTSRQRALPLGLVALLVPVGVAAAVTPQAQALGAAFLASAPPPPAPAAVCVVDTGVTPTPGLSGAISARLNALGLPALDDAEPTGHGTLVADAIAGRTVGIWPQARIVSVRAWAGDSPQPFWRTYAAGIYACINAGSPIQVINLSVADAPADAGAQALLAQAVGDAQRHDMSVVVSAGNNNAGPPHTPADVPGVIAVAAADATGALCPYSAQAPGLLSAPVCPAVAVTGIDGSPVSRDGGTSLAAPQVSAILAALRTYQPSLSRAQAEDILRSTAAPGASGTLRLDAGAAFRAAGIGSMIALPAASAPAPAAVPGGAQATGGASAALATPEHALSRPAITRRVRLASVLELELAAVPRGAHAFWGGARARALGRWRVAFMLGRAPRRAWIRLAAPGRQSSPRLVITLPPRRSPR